MLTLGSVTYAGTTYTNVTVRIDAYVLLGATPPGSGGTDPTCGLSNFQSALLARINAERAAGATCGSSFNGPAPALQWNTALTNAASVHTQDMVNNNFFSHTGSDGSNAGQRITRQGYQWSTWAENIAAGQPSVNAVMDAWMNSAGHCENIMNPYVQDVGVACIAGPAGGYSPYWTMNLASH
ncbi:MAG: CAP domain-containing protein [Rhodocyclales bacterium]|nr:CAP domain-containing protein [Rhodocyclales bacterium]